MNSNLSTKKITRLYFEENLWSNGCTKVMGLDEVGRGCLAGPVVAAGVIFPVGCERIEGIRDSKKITEKERIRLVDEIKYKAIFCSIQFLDQKEVDRLNILKASIQAMFNCVEEAEQHKLRPDHLLVDGNRFAASLIPYTCLVKGDDRSQSIAAASILAKVARDSYMKQLHEEWPEYGWDSNVGYPSPKHKEAIVKYGITKHHRLSFKLENRKRRD